MPSRGCQKKTGLEAGVVEAEEDIETEGGGIVVTGMVDVGLLCRRWQVYWCAVSRGLWRCAESIICCRVVTGVGFVHGLGSKSNMYKVRSDVTQV